MTGKADQIAGGNLLGCLIGFPFLSDSFHNCSFHIALNMAFHYNTYKETLFVNSMVDAKSLGEYFGFYFFGKQCAVSFPDA